MSGGFKVIEHTSDIGIKVWGRTTKELMEEAAIGMVSQIYDPIKVKEKEIRRINCEADSIEELLYLWLKEILYLMETDDLLFHKFQIERDNFSFRNAGNFFMRASLYGEKRDSIRHDICNEIKAITRHGFYVKRKGPWWEGNLLFDV